MLTTLVPGFTTLSPTGIATSGRAIATIGVGSLIVPATFDCKTKYQRTNSANRQKVLGLHLGPPALISFKLCGTPKK
jgi:hypothetical protein